MDADQQVKKSKSDTAGIPGGLSAVIIAKDEEKNLPAALESLKGIADDIIVVVDDRTKDRTAEIARAAGARAVLRRFDGFGTQKQAALDLATKEWVLSLDADERVDPALASEIVEKLARAPQDSGPSGFDVPRRVIFLGREMRHGGLGREKMLRLFRRSRGRFDGASIHERVAVDGAVEKLAHPIAHETYASISDYLRKMESYSTLEARKKFDRGRRFHWWQHALPAWEFLRRWLLKGGFLDGREGYVWARLSAFHYWVKCLKLRELELQRDRALPGRPGLR